MDFLGVIIFDLDGTLVDSVENYTDAFETILRQHHNVPSSISKDIFLSTAGLPLNEQFELALESYGKSRDYDTNQLIDAFWSMVRDLQVDVATADAEIVRELASAGYTLVVSSGSIPSVVKDVMIRANLAIDFRLMLGTDYKATGKMRKGRGHLELIRSELAMSLTELGKNAVIVGDGSHDIAIAKQFGLFSIARLTAQNREQIRGSKADIYIDNLQQLMDILLSPAKSSTRFRSISSLIYDTARG